MTGSASAADDEAPRDRWFYKDLPYGSQSLYSPLYALLNRGFDTLQLRHDRNIGQVRTKDFDNVTRNFTDPFPAIRDLGWGRFLKTEIFPLTFSQGTSRWVPNYTLHLIGGGQTYAEMREWLLAHAAPPAVATATSIATLFAAAFVNESLENKGVVGFNTDAIADLWVFDIAGVVVFSFERVRRFFGETIILNDWSLQPVLTLPHGDLHNVGNYYSMKIPVPFVDRLKGFLYGGYMTMGGVSVKLDRTLSLSAAAGVRVATFENAGGSARVENYVNLRPAAGLFLDRRESLLVSVQAANVKDYAFSLNVYPNAFFSTHPGIGGFTAIGQDGKWVTGVSIAGSLGLGFGFGTR